MQVTIKVTQEIIDGVTQPKKYDLSILILYGTAGIHWQKDAYMHGLDAETIKELIPRLTRELENALKV